MGSKWPEYAEELALAVEDYCDSCLNNDGLCNPLSDKNDCDQIAPVKEQLIKLRLVHKDGEQGAA